MIRIADLFCCAGGATGGMDDEETKVTGFDIEDQPEYPAEFVKQNVFFLDAEYLKKNFDFIWASPKCQKFAWGSSKSRKDRELNQIPGTRELLEKTGLPYVIENVPNAPLRTDLTLCGEMFGLRVRRHRIFEISGFKCKQPKHPKHKKAYDMPIEFLQNTPEGLFTEPIPIKKEKHSYYAQVAGHGGDGYSFKLKDWQKAMGIDWIQNRESLTQAIPPAYSKYILSEFLNGHK